ncbi:MAG: Ig-like domain-containing protein [Gemmatimonadaceae bacterium]|nr:Ig-like domain-containing protein [Gemmatimonadaceae bacterium]
MILTLVLLAGSGCGDDGGSDPPAPARIEITPATPTIIAGSTVQLTATVRDAGGAALNRPVMWSSQSTGVATVSTAGLVTGVAVGTATISAAADGVVGTVQVVVTPPPVATVAVTAAATSILVGRSSTATAALRDAAGNALTGRTIAWTTSNAAVATVAAAGASTTITAVSVGNATITATSEGVSGSVAITVAPVPVASVTVTPASASVIVGRTLTLSATPLDSAGGALTNRVVTWTSGSPSVATVTATGNTTTLTAVALGTAQVTATVEGRTAVATVSVVGLDLSLTRDTTISGTVDVSALRVPRAVTVTVAGPLTLRSSGPIEIHGSVRANCSAVSITGRSLLTRGTVTNRCATTTGTPPDLLLRSEGGIRLDSATITSSGSIVVTSRPAAGLGRVRARVAGTAADTLLDPCVIQHTQIGSGGLAAPGADASPNGGNGSRGGDVTLECGGHLQALGLRMTSQGGGRGGKGTSTPTQPALGGNGGAGGSVFVQSDGRITFEVSVLFAQAGGRGGDAVDGGAGTRKVGTGGNAGAGGGISVNGAMGTDVRPSGLDVYLNLPANTSDTPDVALGGGASIGGDRGKDASTVPATPGETATATGGKGATIGDEAVIKRVIGDYFAGVVTGAANITVTAGPAGRGGVAAVRAGDGGHGNAQFRDGAKSGDANATGGPGGNARVQDNTKGGNSWPGGPGMGGVVQYAFAWGGNGFGTCDVLPWLPGGNGGLGGLASGTPGTGGTNGSGTKAPNGTIDYLQTMNGGNAAPGAGPGAPGGAGAKNVALIGTVNDDGKSFKPGMPASACVTKEIDTRVAPSGGDQSHENFGRMGPRRRGRFRRDDDDDDSRPRVSMRQSLAVHNVTIEGDGPWIQVRGTLDDQGNFTATGLGTYAGFTGIDARYFGKLVLDQAGQIVGLNGTLEIGKNGKLPGGQPIIYTMTAP